jgi:hypothetical protein
MLEDYTLDYYLGYYYDGSFWGVFGDWVVVLGQGFFTI